MILHLLYLPNLLLSCSSKIINISWYLTLSAEFGVENWSKTNTEREKKKVREVKQSRIAARHTVMCVSCLWSSYFSDYFINEESKAQKEGILWHSSDEDSAHLLLRAQVQYLVGEQRFHKPHNVAKKKLYARSTKRLWGRQGWELSDSWASTVYTTSYTASIPLFLSY